MHVVNAVNSSVVSICKLRLRRRGGLKGLGSHAHLFESLPLVLGRQLSVCNQTFQQLLEWRLSADDLALLRLHPADVSTEGWRRAEVRVRAGVLDLWGQGRSEGRLGPRPTWDHAPSWDHAPNSTGGVLGGGGAKVLHRSVFLFKSCLN